MFRTTAETTTGKKICHLRTNRAFNSAAWRDYCQAHGIIHEFTAPYSSAQNGLAERAIRTTMDDVRTLLRDSGLNHSFWAEAAAYSIDTRNLIPSCRHPGQISLEGFSGKQQDISHLRVFGAKCWAKISTGLGGSKLDPRSVECWFLRYVTGRGNYKVQDVASNRVFVSWDVIFEESQPHRTSANVGEDIPIFEMNTTETNTADTRSEPVDVDDNTTHHDNVPHQNPDNHDPINQPNIVTEQRSTRTTQPLQAQLQSMKYKEHENSGKSEGQDWATNKTRPKANIIIDGLPDDHVNAIACLNEMKASHNIPKSYRHAMATNPERWTIPMKTEMDTLKAKHT
jgi:hypothetical protein